MESIKFQHFQAPTEAGLKVVKCILCYLKRSINRGLKYLSQSSQTLSRFYDADWAGCTETIRSTIGYCIYMGANRV